MQRQKPAKETCLVKWERLADFRSDFALRQKSAYSLDRLQEERVAAHTVVSPVKPHGGRRLEQQTIGGHLGDFTGSEADDDEAALEGDAV